MLCFQIALMSRGAINYANTGYQVKDMLRTIMLHTKITDTLLLVANPLGQSDQALSTKIYLNSKIGGKRNSVFIEPLIDTTLHLSITHNSVIESFKQDTKGITYNDIAEKKNISCITFFENTIERFSSLYPEFDTTHYSKINAGKFLILVRK